MVIDEEIDSQTLGHSAQSSDTKPLILVATSLVLNGDPTLGAPTRQQRSHHRIGE